MNRFLKNLTAFVCLVILLTSIVSPVHAISKKAYRKILKANTLQAESYDRDDLYMSLDWTATVQTPRFVQAKADRMVKFYGYEGQEAEDLRVKQREKFSNYTAFYINFYTYNYLQSDITQERFGWKLYLKKGDAKIKPLKIEKIDKLQPLYESLYPYSNVWSRYYYVYFPKLTDAEIRQSKLFITGPLTSGTIDLAKLK